MTATGHPMRATYIRSSIWFLQDANSCTKLSERWLGDLLHNVIDSVIRMPNWDSLEHDKYLSRQVPASEYLSCSNESQLGMLNNHVFGLLKFILRSECLEFDPIGSSIVTDPQRTETPSAINPFFGHGPCPPPRSSLLVGFDFHSEEQVC